jgi:hypothetical protein
VLTDVAFDRTRSQKPSLEDIFVSLIQAHGGAVAG